MIPGSGLPEPGIFILGSRRLGLAGLVRLINTVYNEKKGTLMLFKKG